jgi:hypothetical protein
MYYIGKHSGDVDDGYLGSGNRLRKAIEYYGEENFIREILEFADSSDAAYEREKDYLNDVWDLPECYNQQNGGKYVKGADHSLYGHRGRIAKKFCYQFDKHGMFIKAHPMGTNGV